MPYTDLKSYQQAVIIHDFTSAFCSRYIDKFSRTTDQMIQAARSGKQNIAEGSAQSKVKPKSELMLLGVASASLKELLEDYQDYLRQNDLAIWDKGNPRAKEVRNLIYKSDTSYRTYKSYIDKPEEAANVMITLINQTTYLLDQQIRAIEAQHKARGLSYESQAQKWAKRQAQIKKENEFLKQLRDKHGPFPKTNRNK